MSEKKLIKTTGQLRELLVDTIQDVIAGNMEVEVAEAVHKMSKDVSDSLYSETKIRMFAHEIGEENRKMGSMPLGDES